MIQWLLALALFDPVGQATVERGMKELSNWGRWGAADQKGTMNLITPATRKRAAALVKEGVAVSLSRETDSQKSADNSRPFGHAMIEHGSMFAVDTYSMTFHGASMTHLDAQSHVLYQGKVYNGFPASEIGPAGARKLDVTSFREGFFGRGILMDIPKLKGVKYLELSTPIYPEDLDAWEKKAGLKVGSGDIVFIRTGRWARRAEKGPWNTDQASAGLHVSCARWFKQRDVAVIGSDVHAELMPSPVPGIPYPMHMLFVVAMGMPMFDNCDLEPLSEATAARARWEFLLTASPLVVPRGTGSPLNPIAIF
jgi:kynurenine formamidase